MANSPNVYENLAYLWIDFDYVMPGLGLVLLLWDTLNIW